MKPFNREKFLLTILSFIFLFQAVLFAAGVSYCARSGGIKNCPEIGQRYDSTFSVQIATILALLGSGAVLSSQKPFSDDQKSSEPKNPQSKPPEKGR